MKRFGIILFGLSMVVCQPVAAQQTAPTYAPNVPNKTMWQYKFSKGSGVTGDWSGAPQVGPYMGNVGHTYNPAGPAFTLYSVDFANTIYSGYLATALVSNIGVGDMTGTRLALGGAVDALARYQQSAYLASMYFANMGSWSSIQAAIWTIMTPSFGYSAFSNDGTTNWLGLAQGADLSGFDFNSWNVLTPYEATARGMQLASRQEMLAQSSFPSITGTPLTPTVTPEPQTYVLLFSGMIFMVFFGRRRMKEMGYI